MVLESYSHRVFPSKMCATTYNEHGCLFYITIKQLLQFLNNIYRENCIPDEWRNAVITPIFKKGDRREPKKTTEELIFLTHAVRYTLKSLT